jgi:hypothetical protein
MSEVKTNIETVVDGAEKESHLHRKELNKPFECWCDFPETPQTKWPDEVDAEDDKSTLLANGAKVVF